MLNGNSAHSASNGHGSNSNSVHDLGGRGSLPPGWWLFPVVVWRWS